MKVSNKKVYIALGSNLRSFSHKNTKIFFNSVYYRLGLLGLRVKKCSSIWISNPIPFNCGPIFYNSMVECILINKFKQSPELIYNKINRLEKKLGKKLKGRNKQRVIDIDIIDLMGCLSVKNIFLPHPRMHLRKFVLIPLKEIEKNWQHPIKKKNCVFLLSRLKGHQLIKKSKMFS